MSSIKPLHSTIGQPATGDDHYFDRPQITKKIRRSIDNKQNILISAPRRIGKSSILKYLAAAPREGEIIKYICIQSCSSSDDFFQKLFNEFVKDKKILGYIDGYYKSTSVTFKGLISRIRGISPEGGFQVVGHESIDYYGECFKLLENCKAKKTIIMLDEFPDAVGNMIRKDKQDAIDFLLKTRELRQASHDFGLQFIYTGSTGLANVVRQLDKEDLINDLYEIKIPPYSEDDAAAFIQSLVLGYPVYHDTTFELSETVVSHILSKVTWRLPYYLQIIVESLFELSETENITLNITHVDQTLASMIEATSQYYRYFSYWHSRLGESLNKLDEQAAIEILNQIAESGSSSLEHIKTLPLAAEHTMPLKQLLNILEHDGYISEDQQHYGFNSFLLQQWWLKHVTA